MDNLRNLLIELFHHTEIKVVITREIFWIDKTILLGKQPHRSLALTFPKVRAPRVMAAASILFQSPTNRWHLSSAEFKPSLLSKSHNVLERASFLLPIFSARTHSVFLTLLQPLHLSGGPVPGTHQLPPGAASAAFPITQAEQWAIFSLYQPRLLTEFISITM